MAKLIHVKKAQKDNPEHGIKKGQEYWHASYRSGRGGYKRYWTKKPKPSQIASSEYASTVLSIAEDIDEFETLSQEELESFRDEIVERINELASEIEDKFENMPEGLQQGDTGQLLEERREACEAWANAIECVDLDDYDGEIFAEWLHRKKEEMASDCPE